MSGSVHGERQVFRPKVLVRAEEQILIEELNVQEDMTYAEYPVKIIGTSEHVTRNRSIRMCKVQWHHQSENEATWEREEDLKADFPHLFT